MLFPNLIQGYFVPSSITCVNSMEVSYIHIAKARGFTTHWITLFPFLYSSKIAHISVLKNASHKLHRSVLYIFTLSLFFFSILCFISNKEFFLVVYQWTKLVYKTPYYSATNKKQILLVE